ncbi:MAG TPA: ATP-binding protein [Thermoanaerobaculia bacterium]|nr:ATP-binding protein [Thermoanaerobaculia bacterium]
MTIWRSAVSEWIRRFHRRRANQKALQEFSRSLILIVDEEALEMSVSARIKEFFDPERFVLLQPDPVIARFSPTLSSGVDESRLGDAQIPLRGRLARWLAVNEACLLLDRQKGVYDYLDPEEKRAFDSLRVSVCVPLLALNRLTGIILLGSDRTDWRLTGRDIDLLEVMARQASLAFENLALYRKQRERLDRLYRAERLAAVGQLAAGVAHEIRNPLTAIRSTMQYIVKEIPAEEPKHDLIRELLSEVDRINGTVSGLLSISRLGEFQPAVISPLESLRRALDLVQAHASERGVELVADFDPREEVLVLGDDGQLRQVFLNVVLNALQAMPQGGRITATASRWRPELDDGEDEWLQIQIADTGTGIPHERLRKVFDPFFTTKKDGTGLGLAICHGIVERHRGEMHLESEEGRGTTVFIRLPLEVGGHGEDPHR